MTNTQNGYMNQQARINALANQLLKKLKDPTHYYGTRSAPRKPKRLCNVCGRMEDGEIVTSLPVTFCPKCTKEINPEGFKILKPSKSPPWNKCYKCLKHTEIVYHQQMGICSKCSWKIGQIAKDIKEKQRKIQERRTQ